MGKNSKAKAWIEHREETLALITLLAERFPACFAIFERRRRPLKVGINQDIIAAVGLAPDELGRALRRYTQADGYLAKLRAGAARIALDGQAAGAVTEDEAKAAAALLAKRKAQSGGQTETICGTASARAVAAAA